MRNQLTIASAVLAVLSAGCRMAGEPERGRSIRTAAVPRLPAPANRWVLRHRQAPNIMWENGITYDPATRQIVWHGGHVGRLYPQSNYTFLYDVRRNRFRESQAPTRPQRRCLVHVSYIGSLRRAITTDGGAAHGSIPGGGTGGDFTRLWRTDPRGPWLYDAARDTWEDCRTLQPIWQRAAHAPVAYEPGSDALFGLRGEKLYIYSAGLNRVFTRELPEELHRRLGYAMAADPVRRKLVLFGGSAGGGYQWVKPKPGQTRTQARREAYARMVKRDTWIYDIVADSWKKCAPKLSPPRGIPMLDMLSIQMTYHHPSGTMLVLQNSVDELEYDNSKWPPAALWSFDPATEEWKRVPTADDPPFMGLITYSPEEDLLFLFGGGRDGLGDDGKRVRPALSRQVRTCRPTIPGRAPCVLSGPARLRARTVKEGCVALEWRADPEAVGGYRVFRASCDPLPGEYKPLNTGPLLPQSGSDRMFYADTTAQRGKTYAYMVWPHGHAHPSLPAFNRPRRPGGLVASVEAAREVRLRWNPGGEPDLVGYRVYRARGAEVEKAKRELLTPVPIKDARFVDAKIDLSDGVARIYWVTAVNNAGVESGASPLAYTFPDAPARLTVPEGLGPSNGVGVRLNYLVSWQWPEDVRVRGFNVYHATEVPNGSSGEIFRKTWKKIAPEPVAGPEYVFELPEGKTGHHYFFVRAVNVLGQEGFYTDIVSPTDRRFRP
ncbi:MAG: fibronectin type III domain-containing protein [Planctomycetota bacterium]|jgi:hypothetical protein